MVEVTKELMLTQSREFLPIRKKESPHSVHNPEVSQLAMIVLSVWALPLAKLSAAAASRDQRGCGAGWLVGGLNGWVVGRLALKKAKARRAQRLPRNANQKWMGRWFCGCVEMRCVWVCGLVG